MKNRRTAKNRMSDRERWRNLCDALAEDALRASHPHSGQQFPRPSEEDWRKLCDWPREADYPSEAQPTDSANIVAKEPSFSDEEMKKDKEQLSGKDDQRSGKDLRTPEDELAMDEKGRRRP
jgi:hypothetical protein